MENQSTHYASRSLNVVDLLSHLSGLIQHMVSMADFQKFSFELITHYTDLDINVTLTQYMVSCHIYPLVTYSSVDHGGSQKLNNSLLVTRFFLIFFIQHERL